MIMLAELEEDPKEYWIGIIEPNMTTNNTGVTKIKQVIVAQ